MGQYIKHSWNGNISTQRAFWVNLVLLQLIAGTVFGIVLVPMYLKIQTPPVVIDWVGFSILFVLFLWASIGIWRSSAYLVSIFWKIIVRSCTVLYASFIVWSFFFS
jgi:hypothetical protein